MTGKEIKTSYVLEKIGKEMFYHARIGKEWSDDKYHALSVAARTIRGAGPKKDELAEEFSGIICSETPKIHAFNEKYAHFLHNINMTM